VHVAPGPERRRTLRMPLRRGPPATSKPSSRCKQRRPPPIRRRRKSTTSAAIIGMSPRRSRYPRVARARVEGAGARSSDARRHGPPKGRDNRTADERRPRRTANVEPTPGNDRTKHPRVVRAAARHAPEGVCARMTSRTEERGAGCSQGDTASELGKLDFRALLPSRIRTLAQPVRLRAGRCSHGLPPLQGFLPRGREPAFTGSPLTGLACALVRRP
jgi:hypothetical protein